MVSHENKFVKSGLLTLLLLFFGTGIGAENTQDKAAEWLERMNQAVVSMDYEGHFVYQCGKSLEAMHLRHQIGEDGARESLSSLTGIPREVIRDSNAITIITTGSNGELHISQQPASGKLSPLKSIQPEKLRQNYRLSLGGQVRVAGRVGVVIDLLPRDDYRFGYHLTLDKVSALPLDLSVVDSQGELQSRIMFTDLKITDITRFIQGADVDNNRNGGTEGEVMLASLGNASAGLNKMNPAPSQGAKAIRIPARISGLPAGFSLVSHQQSANNGLEHFVFSDGLATVSVYLELLESDKAFEGFTNLGSVSVYGRRLKNYQMTAVGEVPQKTLELLVGSVQKDKFNVVD
jgi:sigma-E factor negative regulatory protein RseB